MEGTRESVKEKGAFGKITAPRQKDTHKIPQHRGT